MYRRPQQDEVAEATQVQEPAQATATDVALGYDESWLGSLLRPLLIFILVLCINVALSILLQQYAPGMGAGVRWAILALGIAAAVVGVTTTTWLAHPNQRLRRSAGYRVAEIVLILLVSRVVLWLAYGQLPSVDAFLMRPDEVFFDGPYLLTLIALLFTWFAAIDFTDDLAQLALQPDELHVAQTARSGVFDSSRPAQGDRRAILRRIVARWVGWGIFLIFIASALRMGVTRERFWTLARQDVHPAVIAVIVVYFLCGLLLLSQGQLAVLRARWTIDRLPTSNSILRNWPIYTLVVLLTTALLAVFLPLGDTLLISRVLGTILDALYFVVSLIFQLVSLLLILLFSLLPRSQSIPPPPPAQDVGNMPPPMPPMVEIPPWIGGALFWTTILFILALAAYFYFTDKQTNWRWLRKLRDMLSARWQQLRTSWRTWRRSQQLRGGAGLDTALAEASGRRRWWPLRWGGLNPEQQVRYLYFQLLERAAEYDKPRHENETPAAYAPRLSEEVGAQAQDKEAIDALTTAFVQVRYAGQPAQREQVSWLAQLWDRLRKVFVSQH